MKKRIFSGILAVVTLVTAIFAMPKIQKTTAYDTFGTNSTWNSSYHALSEDVGTAAKPGYIGKNTYTLTAGENEYSMPDKWAVVTYNDCEAINNADGIATFSDHAPGYGISYEVNSVLGAFKNLPTYDGGSNCFVAKHPGGSGGVNIVANITNGYQTFDITPYQYFRMHLFNQNMRFVPGTQEDRKYVLLQIDLTNGEEYNFDITDKFNAGGTAHDILWDVSHITGTVKQIQVHLSSVNSYDSNSARIAIDNLRFIKNATHTDVYSYTPQKEIFRFHDCDTTANTQVVTHSSYSNYSKYWSHTNNSGSIVDGAGSAVFGPTSPGYGKADWYQVAFQNATGVIPSEYQYLRFYMYFGNKYNDIVKTKKMAIYFNTEFDYNANKGKVTGDLQKNDVTIANAKLDQGWYMVTVNCQGIKQRIKSISLVFGEMNVADPGSNQDQAKIHIDYIHFLRYNYTPNTIYSYLPGHYKVLESFEDYSSTVGNTSWQSYIVNREVIEQEAGYKNSFDGWATGRSGTTAHPTSGTGMFSASYPHTVTQGRYASIWRPNINNNRDDCWVRYQFKETYDLSKFTHFSLDMSLRDMHMAAPRIKYDKYPGLTGNNERFMISLVDVNGNTSNLVFYLKKTHDYNNFISSPDHGIEGYPLYGFVPGYNERDHGPKYTPVGPMRLVADMGQVMEHRAGAFDITKVKAFTLTYVRSGSGRADTDYEYTSGDNRRVEIFLDNFVAFTPDMTLNVQTTGVSNEDAGQRVVIGVNGNDTVTNHVDIEYSSYPLTNNGLEIISNIPLNSYLVSMEPWAWRYHQTKKIDYISVPRLNDTVTEGYTGLSLGYKAICNNRAYLNPTVTFDLTRYYDKWLDGNGYAAY